MTMSANVGSDMLLVVKTMIATILDIITRSYEQEAEVDPIVSDTINLQSEATPFGRLKSVERELAKLLKTVSYLGLCSGTSNVLAETSSRRPHKFKTKYVPLLGKNPTMLEFTKYFSIEFSHESIRDVNPYDVRAAVMKVLGVDSLHISGGSGSAFTVQVNDKVQGVKFRELTQVKTNVCRVVEHRFLNFCKGIIYIQDYDIDDMEEFKIGLQ